MRDAKQVLAMSATYLKTRFYFTMLPVLNSDLLDREDKKKTPLEGITVIVVIS